jgi:ERCC4-type nuclease
MEKKLIISSIASLNYFKGFSVIRTSGIQETAEILIYMADKIDRNFMKGILPSYLVEQQEEQRQRQIPLENTFINEKHENIEATQEKSYSGFVKAIKKENITQDNISEIMLCQIPGISSIYAKSIITSFGGFSKMVEKVKNGSANFENIMYETKGKQRRIPKTCGEQIVKYIQGL